MQPACQPLTLQNAHIKIRVRVSGEQDVRNTQSTILSTDLFHKNNKHPHIQRLTEFKVMLKDLHNVRKSAFF